jgi:hypothetical protein
LLFCLSTNVDESKRRVFLFVKKKVLTVSIISYRMRREDSNQNANRRTVQTSWIIFFYKCNVEGLELQKKNQIGLSKDYVVIIWDLCLWSKLQVDVEFVEIYLDVQIQTYKYIYTLKRVRHLVLRVFMDGSIRLCDREFSI